MVGVVSRMTQVVRSRDQVSSDLGGEMVILNLRTGVYYGLDEVGTRIWSLMQEPIRLTAIRDSILAEYDVSADQCERDLLDLIAKLDAEGLVEIQGDSGD